MTLDDELYEDENPMEYHDKMEQLWNETKESLKEKTPEVQIEDKHIEMDSVVNGVRESAIQPEDNINEIKSETIEPALDQTNQADEKLVEKTGDLFAGFKDEGSDAIGSMTEVASNAANEIKDAGSDILDGARETASDAIDEGKSMLSGTAIATGAAVGGLLVGAKKMVENTVEGASDIVDGSVDFAKEGISKTGETLNDTFNAVKEKTGEIVDGGTKSINEAATSFVDNDIPAVLRPKDIFQDELKSEVEEKVVEEDDERIDPAKEKITAILGELKENNYNKDYGILGYLLSFPIILVTIWQFIQMGFTIRIGVVALLAIFFIIYRGAVKGITKKVFDLKAKVQVGQMTPRNELFSKIEYVLSGIELNLKRINYTKWLYLIFSPFLFYGLGEIWKGPFDAKTSFYMFVVGFALSLIIWPFVFKSDYKKLEELELDLINIKRDFIN